MTDNRSITCPDCGGWLEIDAGRAVCDTCGGDALAWNAEVDRLYELDDYARASVRERAQREAAGYDACVYTRERRVKWQRLFDGLRRAANEPGFWLDKCDAIEGKPCS